MALNEKIRGKIIINAEKQDSWMNLQFLDGTELFVKAAQNEFLLARVEEPRAEKGNVWTAVKDACPEPYQPVLIYHRRYSIGWLTEDGQWLEKGQGDFFFGCKPRWEVTHWAPLPPEPARERKTKHSVSPFCAGCKNYEPR